MFSCNCLSRQQIRSMHSTPTTEPSNLNIETILLLLVRDDSSTQLKWNENGNQAKCSISREKRVFYLQLNIFHL